MLESGRTENFRRAEEGSRGGGEVINDRPAGRIIFSGDERGRVWRDGFLEGERKKKRL